MQRSLKTLGRAVAGGLIGAACLLAIASTSSGGTKWKPPDWRGNPIQPQAETDAYAATLTAVCTAAGCRQFSLEVLNKTDDALELIWDKTQYIEGDQTRGGFVSEGLRFIERDRSRPPDIILPRGKFSKVITPSILVNFESGQYGRGWVSEPMGSGRRGAYVTLSHKGEESQATLLLDISTEPPPEASPTGDSVGPVGQDEPAASDLDSGWHVMVGDDDTRGPMTLVDLRALIKSGDLTAASRGWHPSLEGWRPLRNIPAVDDLFAPEAPEQSTAQESDVAEPVE